MLIIPQTCACLQIYLVSEFVTYPKGKKSPSIPVIEPTDTLKATTTTETSSAPDNDNTPSIATTTANGNGNGSIPTDLKERIARDVTQKKREDGSVLHCFGVSVYVFKVGRITVPPVSLFLSFLKQNDMLIEDDVWRIVESRAIFLWLRRRI